MCEFMPNVVPKSFSVFSPDFFPALGTPFIVLVDAPSCNKQVLNYLTHKQQKMPKKVC